MGKKDGKRKRIEEDCDEEADPELEAEMAALTAMRAEKMQQDVSAKTSDKGDIGSAPKNPYNRDGILQALEGFGALPFVESLQLSDFPVDVHDENNDLERETAFYNQALFAAKEGRNRLAALGIPTRRPPDYFAENVKSDAHMSRVKDRLLLEEKKMAAFEQRKQREVNRKFNKEVADLRKKEKSQRSKGAIDEISKLAKTGGKPDRFDKAVNSQQKPPKSAKRLAMDRKYGTGARAAKKAKMTDKRSLNDLSDYNPRGGKFVRRESHMHSKGGPRGGKKKGGKPNRPGKAARSAKREARGSKPS